MCNRVRNKCLFIYLDPITYLTPVTMFVRAHWAHTHAHARVCPHTNTHTEAHSHTHTHPHTNTRTQTQSGNCFSNGSWWIPDVLFKQNDCFFSCHTICLTWGGLNKTITSANKHVLLLSQSLRGLQQSCVMLSGASCFTSLHGGASTPDLSLFIQPSLDPEQNDNEKRKRKKK